MRKPSYSRKKSAAGGTLLGLFIGLVIGMLIAAALVWYLNETPLPFPGKSKTLTRQNGEQLSAPLPLPGKPGDPIPESSSGKSRTFEFYNMLPRNADAPLPAPSPSNAPSNAAASSNAPPRTPSSAPSAAANASSSVPLGNVPDPRKPLLEPLFLQTGSFQTSGEAESQKVRLAMLSIEASIQQVMVQDKVWYRVRVGPFGQSDELAGVRSVLAKQGIQANTVK